MSNVGMSNEENQVMCPIATIYAGTNISNHIACNVIASYGPPDPTESNDDFWKDKANRWSIPLGEARSRLCMNCNNYDNSEYTMRCISKGNGAKVKVSDIPFVPRWVDTDAPKAVCTRFNLVTTSIRSCEDWIGHGYSYGEKAY